jgi:hypothetical protein
LGSVVVTGRCESDDELARARLVNLIGWMLLGLFRSRTSFE